MKVTPSSKSITTRRWFHIIPLIILGGLLTFYFFFVGKYPDDEWYYTADADAVFATQMVTLLNDGDFYYLHHPGATVYMAQAPIFRFLSNFNPGHQAVLRLSEIGSDEELRKIMVTTVNTGRVVALLILVALSATIYFFIFSLTKNWILSFIFSSLVILSDGSLRHIGIIRAETSSVLYFFVASLLFVWGLNSKKHSRFLIALSFVGVFIGLAIFSKVQILPAVLSLVVFVFILSGGFFIRNAPSPKSLITNLGIAVLNIFIFPYWTLAKPKFLTLEHFMNMDVNDQAVYGRFGLSNVNFITPALLLLLMLVFLSFAFILLNNRGRPRWFLYAFAISVSCNMLLVGGIFAVYLVMAPASVSLEGYINNTHQLVFATITNMARGGKGFLMNENWTLLRGFMQTFSLHEISKTYNFINILYVLIFSSSICIFRVLRTHTLQRWNYLVPLSLYLTGLTMDLVGSFRLSYAYTIYPIYSVGFYGVGLAYFSFLELIPAWKNRKVHLGMAGVLILFGGVVNFGSKGYQILNKTATVQKQESYTENDARWMSNVYIPQFPLFSTYADLNRRACITSSDLQQGVRNLPPDTGLPSFSWDLFEASSANYPSAITGEIIGENDEDMENKYPIFDQSSGAYIYPDPSIKFSNIQSDEGEITISLWVKILEIAEKSGGEGETILFGFPDQALRITIINVDSVTYLRGYYGNDVSNAWINDNEIFLTAWHHVVFVRGVDGVSLTVDGLPYEGYPSSSTVISSEEIPGINVLPKPFGSAFQVASIVTWPKALNKDQIQQLYSMMLWDNSLSATKSPEVENDCTVFQGPRGFFALIGETRR